MWGGEKLQRLERKTNYEKDRTERNTERQQEKKYRKKKILKRIWRGENNKDKQTDVNTITQK